MNNINNYPLLLRILNDKNITDENKIVEIKKLLRKKNSNAEMNVITNAMLKIKDKIDKEKRNMKRLYQETPKLNESEKLYIDKIFKEIDFVKNNCPTR